MEHYAKVAVEWFLASGERTPERLDELLDHFAETAGGKVDWHSREQAFRKVGLKP